MGVRTDLAVESAQRILKGKSINGVKKEQTQLDDLGLEITEICIESKDAAEKLEKPMGKYVTIRFLEGTLDEYFDDFEGKSQIIGKYIENLCKKSKRIMVVGLGNRFITPDAVGPLCAEKIFATRHIKKLAQEIDSRKLAEVCSVQTGVTGQTGIEAAGHVKALCAEITPECVIAVDAFACSTFSHLGRTIQLSDTGISPGSGVQNRRAELSQKTLGIPCIAVGVPTVVDMNSVSMDLFGKMSPKQVGNMMVTPRNVDLLVRNSAKYIALGINLAFQKSLTAQDIISLTQ